MMIVQYAMKITKPKWTFTDIGGHEYLTLMACGAKDREDREQYEAESSKKD